MAGAAHNEPLVSQGWHGMAGMPWLSMAATAKCMAAVGHGEGKARQMAWNKAAMVSNGMAGPIINHQWDV